MRLRRRTLLASLGAFVIAVGAFSVAFGYRSWLRLQLMEAFGEEIAGSEETDVFLDDFLEHVKATEPDYWERVAYFRAVPVRLKLREHFESRLRRELLWMFLHSTNAVQAQEMGQDFTHVALYLPYENACTNQLAFNAL